MGKRQRFHRKNCSNGNGHKDKASLQISGQVLLSWRPKPRLSPPIQATAVTSVSCISFFGDSCFHSPLQTEANLSSFGPSLSHRCLTRAFTLLHDWEAAWNRRKTWSLSLCRSAKQKVLGVVTNWLCEFGQRIKAL